jgi:hypothetical protein
MDISPKGQQGFIALVSLLIVAAAALTIGIAVSLRGMEELQLSLGSSQAAEAKNLAEACVEEGLDNLRGNWTNYSDSLSIGENSCIINAEVDVNSATLWATGTADVYTQKIEVKIDNNLDVIYWQDN